MLKVQQQRSLPPRTRLANCLKATLRAWAGENHLTTAFFLCPQSFHDIPSYCKRWKTVNKRKIVYNRYNNWFYWSVALVKIILQQHSSCFLLINWNLLSACLVKLQLWRDLVRTVLDSFWFGLFGITKLMWWIVQSVSDKRFCGRLVLTWRRDNCYCSTIENTLPE